MGKNINLFIGKKIKELRIKKNITQEELGEYLDTTSQTISRYESGKLKTNQDILFKLAEYFNVSINDFFPPLSNNLSEFLGDVMFDQKTSITELSILTGIEMEEIKTIYNNQNKLPKPSYIIKISEALNIEPKSFLAHCGYLDDGVEMYDDLYETGIRYLLDENERKILCEYVCSYWNAKQAKHVYTYEEVYNAIFVEEKKNFSYNEVKNILIHNTKDFENIINVFSQKVCDGDIINISDLSDKDKEQIKYMIDLMRNNQSK